MAALKTKRQPLGTLPLAVGGNPAVDRVGGLGTGGLERELGRTGLRYWYGRLDEEFLSDLKWPKAGKVYHEMMDNDPTVGALFNAILLLARAVPWRVEHESDGDPRTELLETAIQDMSHSWEDLISEILRGMLGYGWQYHELVYKRRVKGKSAFADNLIGWKKIPVRAQDTLWQWVFQDDGGIDGMTQLSPPDYKFYTIPIQKALLFRTESIKGSPEGHSILRNAYRPWYFLKHMENIEGIGVERELAGLPVLYAPARLFDVNASSTDQQVLDELKQIVTNIKQDEQMGVCLPMVYDDKGNQLYKLELLSTGGPRQLDTGAIIDRYSLRILQLCLADFIQIGHEGVGSYALIGNKTNLFSVAIGVFLDQIGAIFNRFAIPRLLELNGMDLDDPPILKHGDIENRNLLELGDALSKLSGAGMPLFPNPRLEARLYEILDLPVPSPEEAAQRDAEVQAQQQATAEAAAAQAAANQPSEPAPAESKPAESASEDATTKAAPQTITVGSPIVVLPEQPAPIIHVHPQTITVGAAQAPNLTFQVPEQAPPVVHVASPVVHLSVPDQLPPVVHVESSVIPAPQVTVVTPAPQVTIHAPAPLVKVETPVTVLVPETPAPIVHVEMPPIDLTPVSMAIDHATQTLHVASVRRETWLAKIVGTLEAAVVRMKKPSALKVIRNAQGLVDELVPEPKPEE